MKPSGFLFYLPVDMFPALGNTPTSQIKLSTSDTVSGEIHILSSGRKQVIKELRQLADELEKVEPKNLKLET